jgi:hypothetical protein
MIKDDTLADTQSMLGLWTNHFRQTPRICWVYGRITFARHPQYVGFMDESLSSDTHSMMGLWTNHFRQTPTVCWVYG